MPLWLTPHNPAFGFASAASISCPFNDDCRDPECSPTKIVGFAGASEPNEGAQVTVDAQTANGGLKIGFVDKSVTARSGTRAVVLL